MTELNASAVRANFYRLLDETAQTHKPVRIAGKRNNAVLVAEEDWNAIQETLFLLSVPGMRESVREGLRTPANKMAKALRW
jgi:prevent-host-death family protein